MKINKFYFLFALCCLLLCFASCRKQEPQTKLPEILPAPQNLRVEDEILKWDAVEGASGYVVTEGEEHYEASGNQLDIFSLTLEREKVYSFTVVAKGDDQSFWDSERSASCEYQLSPKEVSLLYALTEDGSGYMVVRVASPNFANGKVIIPESVEGLPVKRICESGFANSPKITGVYIPDSVEVIERSAFKGCESLVRVRLPEGLETIEQWVFRDCASLKQLELPRCLKTITTGAFGGCEQLASLHLPENVEKIFARPGSEDSTAHLNGLTVAPENPIYRSESNCVILRADDTLVWGCNASVIPQSVRKLGNSAFVCCQMTEMTVPANVEEIGGGAFYFCKNLKTVTLEEGIQRIESNAFASCISLEGIFFPASAESIARSVLYYCISLEKLEVAEGNRFYKSEGNCLIKRSEPHRVIAGCKESVIPEGITTIGEKAFYQLPIKQVILPEGVTTIETRAFFSSGLERVVFPSTLKEIHGCAFTGCYFLDTPIVIPAGVEMIGGEAFNIGLTPELLPENPILKMPAVDPCPLVLLLPSSVQVVGDNAFACTVYTDVPAHGGSPEGWSETAGGSFYNCEFKEENGTPYVNSMTLSFENGYCITVNGISNKPRVPYREGYTFAGWATEPNGEAVYTPTLVNEYEDYEYYTCLTFQDIMSYCDQGDTTLYAVWVKNA